MPRSIARVVRRGDVFYFRMAIPRRLMRRLGKRELKVSLRTSNPVDAKVRGRVLSSALDLMFDGLQRMPNLTPQTINERVRASFQGLLNKSLEWSYLLPGDPACDIAYQVEYLREQVEAFRRQLVRQSFSAAVKAEAEELLVTAGQKGRDSDALQHACNAIARARLEDARILAARLSGDFASTAPVDPLFAGMEPTGLPPIPGDDREPVAAVTTFAATTSEFYRFKSKHDWTTKTAADVDRVLRLAGSIIGKDKPIRAVDINDVKSVRDALANLPPNYMKTSSGKSLTVEQAIAANKNGPTLSRKTQDKYFTMFRQLLIWAAAEGHIDKVPGAGVKVAGVGKTNPAERRNPYSAEQLKSLFTSPLFTGHRSEVCRHSKGKLLVRDGKYWVPLIALYSGMRMGEIAQLQAGDLRQEGGIWFFDVNKGEDGEKRLKTIGSKRRVPVHPALISLGLLDHASGKKPNARLFADIEKGKDGYYSHNFSKWYGRYARKIGISSAKTAFHSLRHNFKDALQAADTHEYVSRALLGHADKSVHAQYGSGPTLKALKAAVDKIEFGIAIAHGVGAEMPSHS